MSAAGVVAPVGREVLMVMPEKPACLPCPNSFLSRRPHLLLKSRPPAKDSVLSKVSIEILDLFFEKFLTRPDLSNGLVVVDKAAAA